MCQKLYLFGGVEISYEFLSPSHCVEHVCRTPHRRVERVPVRDLHVVRKTRSYESCLELSPLQLCHLNVPPIFNKKVSKLEKTAPLA